MFHVLIGAALGAITGAVISAASNLVRGESIDWKRVGASALGGAATGAVLSLTFGAGALATTATARGIGMVGAGATGGGVERATDNVLNERDLTDGLGRHVAVGGAFGLTGGVGRQAAPIVRGASRKIWRSYMQALHRRPLLTKSLTSGAVTGTGDLIVQSLGDGPIDLKRTAAMTAFGGLYSGPIGHYWYGFLARAFPGRTIGSIGRRVVLDQIVLAPVTTGLYFGVSGVADGDSSQQIWERMKRDYWKTMIAGTVVWPGVQAVNFRYVANELQVGFLSVAALGWSTYMAATTQTDMPTAQTDMPTTQTDAPTTRIEPFGSLAEEDAGLTGAPLVQGRPARVLEASDDSKKASAAEPKAAPFVPERAADEAPGPLADPADEKSGMIRGLPLR